MPGYVSVTQSLSFRRMLEDKTLQKSHCFGKSNNHRPRIAFRGKRVQRGFGDEDESRVCWLSQIECAMVGISLRGKVFLARSFNVDHSGALMSRQPIEGASRPGLHGNLSKCSMRSAIVPCLHRAYRNISHIDGSLTSTAVQPCGFSRSSTINPIG